MMVHFQMNYSIVFQIRTKPQYSAGFVSNHRRGTSHYSFVQLDSQSSKLTVLIYNVTRLFHYTVCVEVMQEVPKAKPKPKPRLIKAGVTCKMAALRSGCRVCMDCVCPQLDLLVFLQHSSYTFNEMS